MGPLESGWSLQRVLISFGGWVPHITRAPSLCRETSNFRQSSSGTPLHRFRAVCVGVFPCESSCCLRSLRLVSRPCIIAVDQMAGLDAFLKEQTLNKPSPDCWGYRIAIAIAWNPMQICSVTSSGLHTTHFSSMQGFMFAVFNAQWCSRICQAFFRCGSPASGQSFTRTGKQPV